MSCLNRGAEAVVLGSCVVQVHSKKSGVPLIASQSLPTPKQVSHTSPQLLSFTAHA
jgi:hypothetical protein